MYNSKPKDIYSALVADDRMSKLLDDLYTNPVEKYALRLGALFLLSAVVLMPFDRTSLIGMLCALLAVTCALLYLLASSIGSIRYMLTPTKSYFNDLVQRIEREETVVAALANQSPEAIESTKHRLEFEKDRLASRIGFLLGVVNKLGIIPAFISLYLAYAKVTDDPLLEHVPYPVLGFICGIYVGAFFNKHLSDRFEVMILVLGLAHEKAKQRRTLQEP